MRFFVFGFTKNYPKVARAKNSLSINPYSFEVCQKTYEDAIKSGKYSEVYFLVDFGCADELPFFKAIPIDIFNFTAFPWLPIEVAIIDWQDPTKVTRINKAITGPVVLKLKGFTEKFTDPLKGFKKFDFYVQNKIKCELFCDVFKNPNLFVCSSDICVKRLRDHTTKYCKKYRI